MKRNAPKTRWNLIIILIIFGAISYAGYKYFMSAPQPADIFLVTPDSLVYGDTTVEGTIQKDSGIGEKGNYFLALPDLRHIKLEVQGLDKLIGQKVSVAGYLEPASDTVPMTMSVTSLTTK